MKFEILFKPTFLNLLLSLPHGDAKMVNEKINLVLGTDPRPDGDRKKKLKQYHDICRLRCGDYRVAYNYGDGWVQILVVKRRKDIYNGNYFAEEPHIDLADVTVANTEKHTPEGFVPSENEPKPEQDWLPVRLDTDLLNRLRIPDEFHAALIACKTTEQLVNAPVPDDVRNRVFDVATNTTTLDDVLAQPTFVVQEEDDLVRFVDGELLGFLLKLNPEQERLVDWGMHGSGPTLVKGGPGTGKSTVALYRVQAIVRALKASGVQKPHILFTTYTNALVTASEQLLRRLLGEDARYVEVRTADSLVSSLLKSLGIRPHLAPRADERSVLDQALASAEYGEDPEAARASIARLSPEYLLEEIGSVIEGYNLDSLDGYLAARRAGRRVPLTQPQRTAVWAVYLRFSQLLDARGWTTFHRLRRNALQMVRAGAGPKPYDGVVIDEAQDLDPTVLRLLVELCAAPNRLFITADANQSIYGSSFRWSDVHQDLRIQGRTAILRLNHRSTREMGEAAESYLHGGRIDESEGEREYVEKGPMPSVRPASSGETEAALLVSFFRQASRFARFGHGGCAVLCPTNRTAEEIAARLCQHGLPAEYMSGDALNLEKPVVKVLNLKSAKGLEFPIVALAGFVENPNFAMSRDGTPEEQEERLLRERRTVFVGMTRAMRALLVVTPDGAIRNPLLQGFEPERWNVSSSVAAR